MMFVIMLALGCWSPMAFAAKQTIVDPELRKLLLEAAHSTDSFTDRFHAEVWLADMSGRLSRYVKDDAKRIDLLKKIHYEANRAELAPELVLAVIEVESNFNRWAISSVGAQGLMQVMPFWLKEIGRAKDNLFEVKTNLRFGCTILRHYLDREKGNLTRALARYNGSLGKFKYPNKVFKKLQDNWFRR
ncbi:MAG: lytic transglycosylase domain-containing protein [Gammaproteobacteria bacterium]|nr:lytic transglycosylase domain-containing protein [Gammaproteobacteria bacterium]